MGLFNVSRFFEVHPKWGGQSCCITVKSLEEQGSNISKKLDHINLRSWKGDVYVRNVILHSCWQEGRQMAENELCKALIDCPFCEMDKGDGFDILCPFGGGKLVLINSAIVPGEEEEMEEERDEVFPMVGLSGCASTNMGEATMAPDLDNLVGYEEATYSTSTGNAASTHKYKAWLTVDGSSDKQGKPQHKPTILRFCSNPLTVTVSEDRLKRVCGFTKYNEPTVTSTNFDLNPMECEDSMLATEDPVITLVRCNGHIFLAII